MAMLPQEPKSLFVKKTVREDLAEMTKDADKIQRVSELCQISELFFRDYEMEFVFFLY